jgi:hypothetical protein
LTYPISDELLDLDLALRKRCAVDAAAIVKLRVFAGMTIDEVARHVGISPRVCAPGSSAFSSCRRPTEVPK